MKVYLLKNIINNLHRFVDFIWYKKNIYAYLLSPFAIAFKILAHLRRFYLQKFKQKKFPIPIIVVGNISVGGVGKTPLVIAIAEKLTKHGLKVGIVSRGYKASIQNFPYLVKKNDNADLVGDEPLLLAIRLDCPVVIAPDRCEAVNYLIANCKPDVIISDDGLQHYKMSRTVEIVVIDGSRMFGNGFCLPAGPLREPVTRLNTVDFIIVNRNEDSININNKFKYNYEMILEPQNFYSCATGKNIPIQQIQPESLAIAAIGNPDRFFMTLKTLGFKIENKKYSDHYKFSKDDFIDKTKSIIMTEKDFVKCRDFADDRMFFLRVSAIINDEFWDKFMIIIKNMTYDKLRGQGEFSIQRRDRSLS